ncbi:MAG: hypothetical protein IT359_15810 [Gemmatimonadaceae bacterium]|nr:hypothetical protein [Gemmatimonadaceae bacterium]
MTLSLTPDIPALQVAGDVADSVLRSALGASERHELFALLDRHFEGVTPVQFARDLEEKDWVLRIRREGRLVGFTTLQLYSATIDGTCAQVLYSGDTIVAPEAWTSPVLARGWIALVRALQQVQPGERWYWLLLSSGFRTYRFLPVFWRDFWPRHDAEAPAGVRETLNALATARFGESYDARAGVVRFAHPQRLRGALADIPDGRTDDPHVRYFLARNPGWRAGDELVCLTELSDANLTAAGLRMVRSDARRSSLSTSLESAAQAPAQAPPLALTQVPPAAP